MRGETQFKQKFPRLELFQSTLPMRGETSMVYRLTIRFPRFQSTLPMRGETTRRKCSGSIFEISIHSPHAGRDSSLTLHRTGGTIFQSTLPMRGETATTYITCRPRLFQSTLPMRGETTYMLFVFDLRSNFNPLSPCGERLNGAQNNFQK